MENNYLSKAQQEQFKEKMAACQDQACRDEVRGEVEELSARQDAALRAACTDPNSGACVQHLVLAQEYAKSDGRDQAMELGLQLDWVRSFREISQFLNGTEGLNVRTTFSDDIVNPWSRP